MQKLSRKQREVMLALFRAYGSYGAAGIPTLQALTGYSYASVAMILQRLERYGYVTRIRRGAYTFTRAGYNVALELAKQEKARLEAQKQIRQQNSGEGSDYYRVIGGIEPPDFTPWP